MDTCPIKKICALLGADFLLLDRVGSLSIRG